MFSRLCFLWLCSLLAGAIGSAQTTRISVLVTTDLHGNLYPWDYYTAKKADRGLAKIATLIRQERERNPNSLLVDCGDTIQGSPVEGVFQEYKRTGKLPAGLSFEGPALEEDPMMAAMNHLGYDAMTVGNHEYNFGLKNLAAARRAARFPWLSANTVVPPGGTIEPFEPYVVKTVGGVKVAVIGLTTPAVPSWEKPENYKGLRFLRGVESVEKALAELREKHHPDLVIVAAHSGLDRDLKSGEIPVGETGFENMIYQVASRVEGVDAIVYGHTHRELAEARIGTVLLHQPKNWGMSLGRVDFELRQEGGKWQVENKHGSLIAVNGAVEPDRAIMAIAKPYHELAERFLATPVAESPAELTGELGRIQDTALLDAIQEVQLHYSKADVSLASMFNPRVRVAKGPMSVREVAALYIYDNELFVIEGNGRMLRAALENSARYFLPCPDEACEHGPLINSRVAGFNYDVAQGVQYEIDLTQPVGQRIRNLRFHGKALEDAQPLRIAVNSYRAAGSGGYSMFRNARVLWKSGEEIRDLIIEYYRAHRKLPAQADDNWRIVPRSAGKVLETDVKRELLRPRAN